MSFNRVGLGLFKGVGAGLTTLIGASLLNFASRYICALRPVNTFNAVAIVALGNFIYGLAVSDVTGNDKVRKYFGIKSYGETAAEAQGKHIGALLFAATNNDGDLDHALESLKHNNASIREQFFIKDFLFSTLENLLATGIGLSVLMKYFNNPILGLAESVTAGTAIASTVRSFGY